MYFWSINLRIDFYLNKHFMGTRSLGFEIVCHVSHRGIWGQPDMHIRQEPKYVTILISKTYITLLYFWRTRPSINRWPWINICFCQNEIHFTSSLGNYFLFSFVIPFMQLPMNSVTLKITTHVCIYITVMFSYGSLSNFRGSKISCLDYFYTYYNNNIKFEFLKCHDRMRE